MVLRKRQARRYDNVILGKWKHKGREEFQKWQTRWCEQEILQQWGIALYRNLQKWNKNQPKNIQQKRRIDS